MSDWKALVGRVTLFPALASPSPSPSALSLFTQIWGGDPDSFQRQTNALMPTIAQGKRQGMTATCSVHPARIDLNLEPAPTPQTAAQSVAVIEDTTELQKQLLQIINVIGKAAISNSIARVALYLHFLTLADDFVEANKTITNVVPKKYGVKITDEEDFIFQINRPQTSKQVPGVKLNVLTKWSVERFQVFTISMPTPGVPMQPIAMAPQNVKIFISPSVVLDYSTPAEHVSPFNATQQSALLTDAFALASEMLKEVGLNITGF
jgi:hypothetical protein